LPHTANLNFVAAYLIHMTNLPEPFQQTIRNLLGERSTEFFHSLRENSPISVRVHPLKNHPWRNLEQVPWSEAGRYMKERPAFTLDPLFHAGTYYVQEASSMFLEQAFQASVDLDEPLRVLDLCAAPGGKSTHILAMLNRRGLLISNEAIRSRASILAENIQKWGYANCVVTNNDPSDFQRLSGFFDVVVVDAPCSGEGLFRKDPGAIAEWSSQNVQLCASRQRRILSDAWDALREGGVLIYSTCTYNTLENEDNLCWLRDQRDVAFVQIPLDPAWGVEEVRAGDVVGYRFFPHRVRGEGFFLSVVRKLESAPSVRSRAAKKLSFPTGKTAQVLANWITPESSPEFIMFNDLVFFLPAGATEDATVVIQNMHVIYAGTNVATVKHEKLIPAHALAMSVDMRADQFPSIDLDASTAIRYLRRETLPSADIPRGFALVRFEGTPIGWVNALPNRVNNLYPAEWRIRIAGR